MQCPICQLRYTRTKRAPFIVSCAHTVCRQCLTITDKCPKCQKIIKTQQNQLNLNYSIMELLDGDSNIIDKLIKVCLVGNSSVGKTSLTKMLKGQMFEQHLQSTIGIDYMFKDRVVDGHRIRYQIWDSAGQQKFRAIAPVHYKNAHIVLLVYDLSSDDNSLVRWFNQIDKHSPAEAMIVAIGNKMDLIEKQTKIVSCLSQQEWDFLLEHPGPHLHISCKNTFGKDRIWQLFDNYSMRCIPERPKKTLITSIKKKSRYWCW